MEKFSMQFMILYILFPVIAVIVGIVAYQLSKHLGVFSMKKSLIIMLCSTLVLGLPGLLGWMDYDFMPYAYIVLGGIYFVLGIYILMLMDQFMTELSERSYRYEFVFLATQLIMGMALFTLLFNLCNELKYGWWACTCILPYLFSSLYRQAYHQFLDIPLEIYKVWEYDSDRNINPYYFSDSHEPIWIDVCKKMEDHIPNRIGARFKEDQFFGEWFQHVIEDNDSKKQEDQIQYHDKSNPFGWIFYIKRSFFLPRKYIDPDKTIALNRIKPSDIITARRVRNEKINLK